MNDVLISVIVPVYNAEAYIRRCVASILGQTHKNLELLLVVDGATDGSLGICRELQTEDRRIVVVDKPNEGVSATRNLGIAMAKGEYVCFVDADDRVEEDYLQLLLNTVTAEKAQLALCQFAFERKNNIIASGEPELPGYDCEQDSLYFKYIRPICGIDRVPYIMASICRGIFEREFLIQNQITFPPCRLYEDQLVLLHALACCKRVATVNRVLYYYNDMAVDSATRSRYKRNLPEDQLVYLTHLERILPMLPITAQERQMAYRYRILHIRKFLLTNGAMNPDAPSRKAEIRAICASRIFDEKIPVAVYLQWLGSQPAKTIVAELLIRLGMYGMLRRLRSR